MAEKKEAEERKIAEQKKKAKEKKKLEEEKAKKRAQHSENLRVQEELAPLHGSTDMIQVLVDGQPVWRKKVNMFDEFR